MTVYLSQITLTNLTGGTPTSRVSKVSLYALYADKSNAVRTSQVLNTVLYADKSNSVRVSQLNAYMLISAVELAELKIFRNQMFGSPTIQSGVLTKYIEPQKLEPNPYKPTLPTDVTVDMTPPQETHAQTQQETIRKQHNITQAGDTTFPWDLIQESTAVAQFNLGSQGRFFTPGFGIVQATYVKFVNIDSRFDYGQMPYGRLKASQGVDWEVTNDLSLSGVELVVGVGMLTALPPNDSYGWVVTKGGTIATLQPYDFHDLQPGDEFTWGTTGTIRYKGEGVVVGRVWGTPANNLLDPGSILIDVGGLSVLSVEKLFQTNFDAIQQAVTLLQQEVEQLQNNQPPDYSSAISKLQQAIQLVANSLDRESAARSAADTKLQNAIGQGQVTVTQFNAYKKLVADELQDLSDTLNAQILKVKNTANAAKGVTDQIDPNYINTTLATLSDLVGRLSQDQANSVSRFPVVTGEVPPVFVYLDDGSLVYVEI